MSHPHEAMFTAGAFLCAPLATKKANLCTERVGFSRDIWAARAASHAIPRLKPTHSVRKPSRCLSLVSFYFHNLSFFLCRIQEAGWSCPDGTFDNSAAAYKCEMGSQKASPAIHDTCNLQAIESLDCFLLAEFLHSNCTRRGTYRHIPERHIPEL